MSIADRLRWIKQFMKQTGQLRWFNNIKGVLESFIEKDIANPGSWLSWTDAGILNSIQNGYASSQSGGMALGDAAAKWKTFFEATKAGADDTTLISLWGVAEKAGTRFGIWIATIEKGLKLTEDEKRFLAIGDLYRGVMSIPAGGSIVGGAVGSFTAGVLSEPLCTGDPTCITGWSFTGSSIGSPLGAFLTDPRSEINGHAPVYFVSTLFLESRR